MGEIKLNDKEKSYVLILKNYFKLYNYWKKEWAIEINQKEIDNKTLIHKGDNSNSSIAFRNNYSNSGLSNRVNSTCLKIINSIYHI